jgi:hypothetical protein
MQAKRSDPARAERAVVLQVLRGDHHERWSQAELEQAVSGVEPAAVSEALVRLAADGVVVLDGDRVVASRCARRLDALGLIAI